MRRLSACALLAAALLALASAPPAGAREEHEVVEVPDGKYLRLHYADDPAAQAWLYRGSADDDEEEPERKRDLVVALHGAGGHPHGLVMERLMELRGAWCLAVAGHTPVRHEQGEGFQWDGSNVAYVAAFVRHLLATRPVDPARVIVWGHSAGGTMTLATLAHAPELFAGGLTTAAPATPDGRHKALRVCVFLGMEDPNWAGASTVRSYLEGLARKRAKGACAFFAVEGLGHDVPQDDYLGLGFDWILAGEARGGEATVPRRPVGRDGAYHHVLVRHKGAEGAGDERRSRSAAQKLLKDLRKELERGRAFFPFEAACHSEDRATFAAGGGIEAAALGAFLPALPDLAPGALSEVLEGPQGLHLVWRPPETP